MNAPFYYSVHAHPHDYYRHTNFALERFVNLNRLRLVQLQAIGGINEILADLVAKVARVSRRHFPFGYFLIAERDAA